jgi:hypothetical protein
MLADVYFHQDISKKEIQNTLAEAKKILTWRGVSIIKVNVWVNLLKPCPKKARLIYLPVSQCLIRPLKQKIFQCV